MPYVDFVRIIDYNVQQDIYVAMVVDLSRKYGVDINKDGYEKLYHDTLRRIGYEQ